jgi:hypothetical protein
MDGWMEGSNGHVIFCPKSGGHFHILKSLIVSIQVIDNMIAGTDLLRKVSTLRKPIGTIV